MIPCLYQSDETKFADNGIGKLADCQSCLVTEKRNGSFELKMEMHSIWKRGTSSSQSPQTRRKISRSASIRSP